MLTVSAIVLSASGIPPLSDRQIGKALSALFDAAGIDVHEDDRGRLIVVGVALKNERQPTLLGIELTR